MTLKVSASAISGKGLVLPKNASSVSPDNPLLIIPSPLVAIPDDKHLDSTCAWCMLYRPKDDEGDDPVDSALDLKLCTGCRVVRYCSKECQSKAWKAHHKLECPRFKALYPRILPASVRACFRLLLLQERLPAGQWTSILALESHVYQHVPTTSMDEKPQMIRLMAKAAGAYSGTDLSEQEVLELYCRVLINSFSITPPTSLEEVGLAFDPTLARINHSCAPNARIHVNGAEATVLAERNVYPGDEITISYVDSEMNVAERRKELKERWFFDCKCERCMVELKGGTYIKDQQANENRDLVEGPIRSGRIIGEVHDED